MTAAKRDALRVVLHVWVRAAARAPVLVGAVRCARALGALLEPAHLGAQRRRLAARGLDDRRVRD